MPFYIVTRSYLDVSLSLKLRNDQTKAKAKQGKPGASRMLEVIGVKRCNSEVMHDGIHE